MRRVFKDLKAELRLRAGFVYQEERDGFAKALSLGEPGGSVVEVLDPALPPVQQVFEHRVYIFSNMQTPASPQALGWWPAIPAAAVVVGRRPKRALIVFLLDEGWDYEELDFTLNTIRAALGARLVDERVRGNVEKATEIQQSLLMEEPPDFLGYEIACRSLPAEEVGGDFFDFASFGSSMLGVAIGDASGHGLPAALLVRDVVTGLRMGIEKDLKVAHVFSKLNRVIHRSNLSSRFVSVFYGELESEGTLVYVNAGHQPPLLFRRDGLEQLTVGGTVIGPLPDVEFRRGVAHMNPGETLVMCTDGILERRDAKNRFLGEEGLIQMVREAGDISAEALLEHVFDTTWDWGLQRPWEDDATLVVVRRL